MPAGERLRHRRAGSGPPLVLIHGIGSTHRAFAPVLPILEAKRDTLAVDLPGFGGSPQLAAGSTPTVHALADAVELEMDAAAMDTADVAGNSLGGWIALELARRGRARTVVGLSPAGMWTDLELGWAKQALRTQRAVAERLASRAELLTRTAAGRTASFSLVSSRPWRIDPGDAAHALEALARAPGWHPTLAWATSHRAAGLEHIDTPVVVAWGTRDRLLPFAQAERFERALPNARVLPLPGLGHVPMWDDPELAARAILEGA